VSAIACPRCGAPVAPDQDWCLDCGAAARTRLAPTPNWRAPVALVAVIALLAGAGLAAAFVALTNDSTKAPATSTAATAPVVATEPTAAPAPTAPPTTATAPAPTTSTPATVPTATAPHIISTATAPPKK
jgi:hypothetical protein